MTVKPRAIRLEASSFCQLRCPSCPTTSRAIHPAVGSGFLRFEDFRKLIDENPGLKQIELSNFGEIFLNPELLQILDYAHRRKVSLSASNGVNLNNVRPELLEGIVKYRMEALTCSIDGASQETYERYRVRGNFARVIANIRKINEFKAAYRSPLPRLRWQFVVFGHNEHQLPRARAMARELGMEFYAKLTFDSDFSPIKDVEAVRNWAGTDAATREEYEVRHGEDYMQANCHQLWDQPTINWDGKLLGCCQNFWGDFGGNAFAAGLTKSVNNEKIVYARAMLLGRKPARDDVPCTSCDIYLKMRRHDRWLRRAPVHPIIDEAIARARRLFRRLGRGGAAGGAPKTLDEVLARARRVYRWLYRRHWRTAKHATDVEALVRARHLCDVGRLSDAAQIYHRLLAERPDHGEALYGVGGIAHELGDHGAAVNYLRRALARRPGDAKISQLLAEALAAGGWAGAETGRPPDVAISRGLVG